MAEEDGTLEPSKPDIVRLLTVGVLGSILSGVISAACLWVRDKRLARFEDNIKNAEQVYLERRSRFARAWYRGFRLLDELSQTLRHGRDMTTGSGS